MTLKQIVAVVVWLGVVAAHAQTPPVAVPVNHEFDFWIGEWTVTAPDGKLVGTSRVEAVAGGHGLYENWEAVAQPNGLPGGSGKSLNAFNPAKNQWQQFWIGSPGNVLELAGGLVEGKMVLASAGRLLRDGRTVTSRITWTPHADGSVRQHWEQSFDAGKTWTTAFDGRYTRKR